MAWFSYIELLLHMTQLPSSLSCTACPLAAALQAFTHFFIGLLSSLRLYSTSGELTPHVTFSFVLWAGSISFLCVSLSCLMHSLPQRMFDKGCFVFLFCWVSVSILCLEILTLTTMTFLFWILLFFTLFQFSCKQRLCTHRHLWHIIFKKFLLLLETYSSDSKRASTLYMPGSISLILFSSGFTILIRKGSRDFLWRRLRKSHYNSSQVQVSKPTTNWS